MALVPTFMINYGGYPKDWDRFTAEAHEWFKDPNLAQMLPGPSAKNAALAQYGNIDQGAAAGAPAEGLGERQAIPQDVRRRGRTPLRSQAT